MTAPVQRLLVDSAWTTQDGNHVALCIDPSNASAAAVLTTPVRMHKGDTVLGERKGRDWRYVPGTEADNRP